MHNVDISSDGNTELEWIHAEQGEGGCCWSVDSAKLQNNIEVELVDVFPTTDKVYNCFNNLLIKAIRSNELGEERFSFRSSCQYTLNDDNSFGSLSCLDAPIVTVVDYDSHSASFSSIVPSSLVIVTHSTVTTSGAVSLITFQTSNLAIISSTAHSTLTTSGVVTLATSQASTHYDASLLASGSTPTEISPVTSSAYHSVVPTISNTFYTGSSPLPSGKSHAKIV